MVMPKKTSRGRQKIEIKRIENTDARYVCFSKRRAGLFKKASELSILCGSEVAIVVFSPAGKAFSFGHPSADSVIDRFLANNDYNDSNNNVSLIARNGAHELSTTNAELRGLVETAKKKSDGLKAELNRKENLLDADTEKMGLEELMEFERKLVDLKQKLAERTSQYAITTLPPPPFGNVGNVSFDAKLAPMPSSFDGQHGFFGFM